MMGAVMVERDGRAMSRMDAESRLVHMRLEAWADWSRDAMMRPFPELTMIGRMIKYGPRGAAQEGTPPISMPDHIAAIDAAVARLGDTDQRAIKSYYLHWEPIENCAKRLRMNVRPFQAVLRRARWRIALFLS